MNPTARTALPTALALLLAPPAAGQAATGESAQGDAVVRGKWFEDVSEATGTLFEHEDGAYSYAMGSGVGWLDLEGDGDEDLLVLNSAGDGRTLRNDGAAFTDVTAQAGPLLSGTDEPIGVSCADFDQDGLTDAYYCNVNRNKLFRNLGGTFLDVTGELGVSCGIRWSTSASWADWDLDGDLDLYVGNYVRDLNFPYHYGEPNVLLENRGPGADPVFLDVAPDLGVDDVDVFGPSLPGYFYVSPEGEETAGCTLATASLDYDEDGDPDLMVGNDFGQWVTPNKLYRNDQSGAGMAFTDVTTSTGFDTRPHYNMGIVPCDFDHDGDWDLYKSNLGDNLLLRNEGGVFVDGTYDGGPISGSTGELLISSWGMAFQDFDNDGWEDVVVANGYIPASDFIDNEVRVANHLWRSLGDGTFERVGEGGSGIDDDGPARGIATADYDGDGLLDLYVQNNGATWVASTHDRSRLFRNTGKFATGSWIQLRAAGRLSNREGFGARIELVAGDMRWKRQVLGDPVYISSPSRVVHVGLGPAAVVDRIDVAWPSGLEQSWLDVEANQRHQLLEPGVVIDSIDPLQYAGGVLSAHATLTNHDVVALDATVEVRVVAAQGGAVLATLSGAPTVPAETTVPVQLDLAVDRLAYQSLQGDDVLVRLSVHAGGALDEDQQAQILP